MIDREVNTHRLRPTNPSSWTQRWKRFARLLHLGVGIKRWVILGAAGVAICSIGFAWLMRQFFDLPFPKFLPGYLEGIVFIIAGMSFILISMYGLYRKFSLMLAGSERIENMADTIYTRWSRGKGPRIVAIGGGTGLSVLLHGLREYTDNLTAIITVADDGGSSGRLRREFGVLPPGDFRNCLVAMSEEQSLLSELFQYRFQKGEGLKGHNFGNLFIAALSDVTGSFERALVESSRVLAVRGRVVPATLANLRLSAQFSDGTSVTGESGIRDRQGEITQILINPLDAPGHPIAIKAIEDAEVVVIGPGSLYTSILPNLLVRDISDALKRTSATTLYVCNVATEIGETQGYTIAEHIEALRKFTFAEIADFVIGNEPNLNLQFDYAGAPVVDDGRSLSPAKLELRDVSDAEHPIRHSSEKLAAVVMDLYGRSITK